MYRFFFLLLLAAACQSPTPSGPGTAAGPRFEFSQKAPETDLHDALNWCTHSFHEAIRLDATVDNANRRVFALGSGVHRVVVEKGDRVASFMLRKTSGQAVELFTSDNYPVCLSDRTKFMLQPNGGLHYNNGKIEFTADVVEQPNGTTVAIEMAPGAGYGFLVHRCEDCN